MKKLTVVASVALLALVGCTKKNETPKGELNPHLKFASNIVSTRPQNSKQMLLVLKLQNPALLESATYKDGKTSVNPKLLTEILKEQQETIVALKELSKEIQVVYTYKMVLNGLAILAPVELESKIKGLGVVAYSEQSGSFEPIKTMELSNSVSKPSFLERNSVKFIGAERLNARGITGKGIKVGIIDTGIDFTHSMLGGVGTKEAYKAVNPSEPTSAFPNAKVVGGIDLVGTTYNAGSPDFVNRIPKPDMNPLDEAGHGSHVAGTVAGVGDNVNSYSGVAPEAVLHAIKVFGAEGSTSDFVVIAALEYAADPNADGDNSDQLDVVNLSLGSSYGNPHILYNEAITNLVDGGTVVVASAGNSGHQDYIVGAPGTSDAALSVAASVDDGDHLWKFTASRIKLSETENLDVEAIEAATTKKISEGQVSGELVAAGLGLEDFSDELAAKVKGKVALMDRGQVNFNDKIKRAVKAGAIGVVMANNKDGAPIAMGTTDKFDIPAIMITLNDAKKVKAAMEKNSVVIDFKTDVKIEKPELIDTLTDFTSKGPRSIDGSVKPEISAPGENVISAAMGGGADTVQMSGTSMAAPHMAGVMALLKQAKPALTAQELKAVAMAGSKTMSVKGERYPVSMQGAGRVQADVSADLKLVADAHAISLGEILVESKKQVRKKIALKNLTDTALNLTAEFSGSPAVKMAAKDVVLGAKSEAVLVVDLTLDATQMKNEKIREMDGWVLLKSGGLEVYRIPVLAVAHKLSAVNAKDLIVNATSELDSAGSPAEITIENQNSNVGEALLFNLIGEDDRKPEAPSYMSSDCDLQSAGYRLAKDEKGVTVLQVAVKLFKPMTTWHACDISLMIDSNGDGVAEQELLGSNVRSIPGFGDGPFATTLLDAEAAREVRRKYEAKVEAAGNDPEKVSALKDAESYKDAIVDQRPMKVYNNSSVAVLEISADALARNTAGAISFKVLVSHNEQSTVEFDDHLQSTIKADKKISLRESDQTFIGLTDVVDLAGKSEKTLELVKGEGREGLLVLFPFNRFSMSNLLDDDQSQVIKPRFELK